MNTLRVATDLPSLRSSPKDSQDVHHDCMLPWIILTIVFKKVEHVGQPNIFYYPAQEWHTVLYPWHT